MLRLWYSAVSMVQSGPIAMLCPCLHAMFMVILIMIYIQISDIYATIALVCPSGAIG